MATTRGWKLRGNIQTALDYILDLKHGEAKTNAGIYTAASPGAGSCYRAGYSFKQKRINMDNPSKNVGYHFQFSLPRGEGTAEECLAAAEEWINMISGAMADYVIAVHTDTSNIHAHIVTDYYLKDGKPWAIYWRRDKHRFRAAADVICKKYGFSVLEKTSEKGRSYYEWMQKMNPDSDRMMLKKILDYAIPRVKSFDDLKKYLEALGFKVFYSKDRGLYSFFSDKEFVKRQPEGNYLVKLLRNNYFIEVDPVYLKWIKSDTKAKITLPLNGDVKCFDENMFFIGVKKVNDLKNETDPNYQKWDGKFVFTANIRMIHDREDGTFLIRIPGQDDYIRINQSDMEWIRPEKTARIILAVDQKVMHYDAQMVYMDRIEVELLKRSFEEKNWFNKEQKKEKIRFKVPGGKRVIREESLGDEYSFDSIMDKINSSSRNKNDPEIDETIFDSNDYDKTEEHRQRVYDFADIHVNTKSKVGYKSQKQANYFKWKESQIDRLVDQINRDTIANRDLMNLNDLRDWRDDLADQLKECYQTINEFDERMSRIMEENMENKDMPDDDAIDEFIQAYRGPLKQQAEEIKSQIKDCNYRIREAERYKDMKNKGRERVISR